MGGILKSLLFSSSVFAKGFFRKSSVTRMASHITPEHHSNGKAPETNNLLEKKLQEFGYGFNETGELRIFDQTSKKLTEEKFNFVIKPDDKDYNQRHYEKLGDLITEYVYELLESTTVGLQRRPLSGGSFVFASPDLETNSSKLLVLIHGSGVVRAGQWARRLIINDNLDAGTQIPYIKRALSEGYAVVVFNTNDNFVDDAGDKAAIDGSENPLQHADSAWVQIVQKSPASHVAIVAHSFGGVVVTHLAKAFTEEFIKRVFAVLLTDSVHSMSKKSSSDVTNHLAKVGINYVTSRLPLGEPMASRDVIPMLSAGHEVHEWTSHSAFDHLFEKMNQLLQDKLKTDESTSV